MCTTKNVMGTWSSPIPQMFFNLKYLINEIVIRLVLALLILLLYEIKPFQKEVYGDDWFNHSYPYKVDQVFSTGVLLAVCVSCIIVIPFIVLTFFAIWKRMPRILLVEEIVSFLLGLILAIEICISITLLIKGTYGRLRPDFLSRCFGNDKSEWRSLKNLGGIPECTQDSLSANFEGRKSFPSGHTSLSFTVFGYLALFTYRKLCQIGNTGSLRLVFPTVFLSFAGFIGITRIQDYRHFPTDVLAGAILGSVVCFITWRFYDRIMQRSYVYYNKKYNTDNPFQWTTPAQYVPMRSLDTVQEGVEEP